MVESGQEPAPRRNIRPVEFAPDLDRARRVDVVDLATVQERRLRLVPGGEPERLLFEMMLFVRSGRGTHRVDFQDVDLAPDRLVRVHPGQVHQWVDPYKVEGEAILVRGEATSEFTVDSPVAARLDDASAEVAAALVHGLKEVQDDPHSGALTDALWAALSALFDHAALITSRELPDAYVAYRRAIEADPARSRHSREYIADLGWSERTVRRACLDATGQTPKQLLDDRLVLEARRLLAYTDRSAASIGTELGFSEATNFHKFFTRLTGESPGAFRASTRR